jgi:hypothetical protein
VLSDELKCTYVTNVVKNSYKVMLKRYSYIILLLSMFCFFSLISQNEITWKEEIVLDGTFKYVRLCKVTKGPAAGDIIMTYFQSDHSAPFGMRRSKDGGRIWSTETIFMRNNTINYFVNPGILQLDDGRLMLSYCKRGKETSSTILDQGPCVRFSTDGGYTWGAETFIAYGGDYEPTAIQVPHDKNGDGHNDIYLYWSMAITDQSYELATTPVGDVKRGFACGVVASYDNGVTWENFMPTKLGARIVHRNFEYKKNSSYYMSKGNMPTPVLLPNHKVGVACEAVDKANSPWFTVSDSGDWDWANFQGQQWSDYTYFGYPPYKTPYDNNVYPTDRSKCYRPTYQDDTFGGAPYVSVMSNGKIVFSHNSGQEIKVFVTDVNGKNPVQQADPFPSRENSFYSCIIPLNDHEVMVAAHNNIDKSQAFVRIGEILKDTQVPTMPAHVVWSKTGNDYELSWTSSSDNNIVHQYEIYANGNLVKTVFWDSFATINGLNPELNYTFAVRAKDYQGNYSELASGMENLMTALPFEVFPNPVYDCIKIKTDWQDYRIEILSVDGKQLMIYGDYATSSVDVSALNKGLYLISVEKEGKKYISKFIKN